MTARARVAVGAAALAVIAALTLVPTGSETHGFSRCLFCNPRSLADSVLNAGLFAPLGWSIGPAGVVAAVAAGAGVSTVVEVLQTLVPGRNPSGGDIIANAIGAALGALLFASWSLLLRPSARLAARLAVAAAILACGVWAATGLLVQPSFLDAEYWGQWTPRLQSLEPYGGRVLDAVVGTQIVEAGPVADAAGLRARLGASEPVRVRFAVGPTPTRVSSVFSVADGEGRRLLLVGAAGDDIVFRYRSRAADWRLDQPDFRSPGALAGTHEGQIATVTVSPARRGWCVRVDDDERCRLGFGPGDGWAFLVPSLVMPVSVRSAWETLWMGVLVVPAGFWARRRAPLAAVGGLLAIGLALIPAMTGLLPARPHEWAGLLGGLVIGGVLAVACR